MTTIVNMAMSLVPLLVMVAVYVWFGLTLGKLFAQLDVEPWKAWVPVINQLEMLKLVNRPSSQIIILCIPLYGLYVYYQVLQEMTRLCGRDEKLALLGLLLPPIWAKKMLNGDAGKPGASTSPASASAPPSPQAGAPQPFGGSMFGPTPQDMFGPTPQGGAASAAVGQPAYASMGQPPGGPAPGFGDPFSPVADSSAAQPQAWPTGPDPTLSGSAWSAAPVLPPPPQGADPFFAAQVPAAPAPTVQPPPVQPPPVQPSPPQAVAPVMPAAPAPVQPSPPQAQPSLPQVPPIPSQVQPSLPQAPPSLPQASAPVQPSPQPPVMTPPVMLPAPSAPVQPSPPPVQPSPPQAVAPVMPAAPAPAQPSPPQAVAPVMPTAPAPAQSSSQPPVMTPPVMLSATPSASAQPAQPAQAAPSEEQVERTVLIDRAASRPWSLLLDDGRRFDLWAPSVLVGRAPSAADPGTQVLAISDETCTISKVHARLDLVDGTWQVADAGSTNGIIVTRGGRAFTVPSGTSAAVDEQLVLGSVGMRLVPGGQLQPARA